MIDILDSVIGKFKMTNEGILFTQITVGDSLPKLEIDITTTLVILGALASRDWQPQHHDKVFAEERNGTRDIFLNTNHNAAMIERYITDWTGVMGRLGKIRFSMLTPVFPGDKLRFSGEVVRSHDTQMDFGWVDIAIVMSVDGKPCSKGVVRVAVPGSKEANPWRIDAEFWNPDFLALKEAS